MWTVLIQDREFLGYGPDFFCKHCKNKNLLQVYQKYGHQKIFSIIPTPKIYGQFFVICGVCHRGYSLSRKQKAEVSKLLDQGKEATRAAFSRMENSDKDKLLLGLSRNGIFEISNYIL